MKILVTGGAGFIGSHVCEYFSKKGAAVIALDNLSRAKLLGKSKVNTRYNWNFLGTLKGVKRIHGSILNFELMKRLAPKVDAIIHTAAQTAVTTSVIQPYPDFQANALGSFHVLEAARLSKKPPAIILCSTNKVYGENVNKIPLVKTKTRYQFTAAHRLGIPENFGIDLCEHTPYGSSKLTADIYAQDYARLYGLKVGVFRMSCIYGTRQFGVEDQGWVAWFTIAATLGKPITIFGDGKQVRDLLWVEDLVRAYDLFLNSKEKHVVVNTGGGPKNTLSLLELIAQLKSLGLIPKLHFKDWRPSDQKVYISDIRPIQRKLGWTPRVSPEEGVGRLFSWIYANKRLFA